MSLLKLTYDDYLHFPDDGKKRELIDGEVYVSPAPTRRHQEVVGRIHLSIGNHLAGKGGGRVYFAPLDVILDISDVVQPDVVFIAEDRSGILVPEGLRGAPSIAVEVLSPSGVRLDRVLKHDLYARWGVSEYWLVDPDANRVEVFRLESTGTGPSYGPPDILEPPGVLTSALLPGWQLPLAGLLAED